MIKVEAILHISALPCLEFTIGSNYSVLPDIPTKEIKIVISVIGDMFLWVTINVYWFYLLHSHVDASTKSKYFVTYTFVCPWTTIYF